MITIDWGNYEESIIILRVEAQWHIQNFGIAMDTMHHMTASKSFDVNILIDIRLAEPAPVTVVRMINHAIEIRSANVKHIVAIMTDDQQNRLRLIDNFYPLIKQEILLADSVEQAYQLITAVA